MTVQFQGHVVSITGDGAAVGMLRVALQTEVKACEPFNLTIPVPKSDAPNWMPGRLVSFTIYTLPELEG